MKCNILQRGKKNESGSQHNKRTGSERNEIFPQAFSDCEALDGKGCCEETMAWKQNRWRSMHQKSAIVMICGNTRLPVSIALHWRQSEAEKKSASWRLWGNDIYQVIARYLEMNGKPYVMELVHRLDEDALTDLEEKQYLIEQLTGYNEKLYQDVLTGVFNRRYYEEKIKNMWGPVGIAMMDLDNFKYYNDSYGHNVGDLALNSAAKVILSNIRKSDFLIRYGGDEFLLVLPGIRKDAFDKKTQPDPKTASSDHFGRLSGYLPFCEHRRSNDGGRDCGDRFGACGSADVSGKEA